MQAIAEASPNIALVKYWGKVDIERNLPAVGSLSITLDSLATRMSVQFGSGQRDRLLINGDDAAAMLPRVSRCLDDVAGPGRSAALVSSESNFPIGAGLASSASAFAALVVAADAALDCGHDRAALAELAGRASGSAARSIFGGYVMLTPGEDGISVSELVGPDDWPLDVVIAITEEASKPVSSGEAMIRSADTSPFYRRWVDDQSDDLKDAVQALHDRDFSALGDIAEHNCLKMHSLTWTSRPPLIYWNSATLTCLETIRAMQAESIPVFFTMDAGPQVKAFCPPEVRAQVESALAKTPGVLRTLGASIGPGAKVVA